MLEFILFFLIILWLLGFIHLPFLGWTLLTLGSHPFTLHDLLILLLLVWVASVLQGTFKTVAFVLLALWLLSLLGVLSGGLANIIIIIIIAAAVFSIF